MIKRHNLIIYTSQAAYQEWIFYAVAEYPYYKRYENSLGDDHKNDRSQ